MPKSTQGNSTFQEQGLLIGAGASVHLAPFGAHQWTSSHRFLRVEEARIPATGSWGIFAEPCSRGPRCLELRLLGLFENVRVLLQINLKLEIISMAGMEMI